MARALISLGSNLGDSAQSVRSAIARLDDEVDCRIESSSRLLQTAPIGGPAGQRSFVNAAATVETSLEPESLFSRLLDIESRLHRVRDTRWGPRTIDLDLLLYDERIIHTERLEVPHPRMAVRRFMLEPAAEIAPDWRDPITGRMVSALFDHLRHAPPLALVVGGTSQQRREWIDSSLAMPPARLQVEQVVSAADWPAAERAAQAWQDALGGEAPPSTVRWWLADGGDLPSSVADRLRSAKLAVVLVDPAEIAVPLPDGVGPRLVFRVDQLPQARQELLAALESMV